MGFEDLLPNNDEEETQEDELLEESSQEKIGQNQVYDLVTGKQPEWQSLIYDLIHTEQLDPWDIDLVVLTQKYFEKLSEMEDTEFYVISKVLFAAALLLRIKSEFLLNKHITSIDEVLFGKKDEDKYVMERIEIDEDELPVLVPRTPLPRAKKVTLQELMAALNKAMSTESRRIKREVAFKRARKLSEVDFPKFKKIDLKDRIRQFYARVLTDVKKKATGPEKHMNKIGYLDLVGKEKEEKLACFLPLLHLSNTQRFWLEQDNHLDEIWIYLFVYFNKNRDKFMEELEEDIEEMKEELGMEAESKIMGEVKKLTENKGIDLAEQNSKWDVDSDDDSDDDELAPSGVSSAEGKDVSKEKKISLADEIAEELKRELEEMKKEKPKKEIREKSHGEKQADDVAHELGEEIKVLEKEKDIEDLTGFSDEQ